MAWYDFYKLWTYIGVQDPLAKRKDIRNIESPGISQPGARIDVRGADNVTAGANAYLRVQGEMVEMTSTASRTSRYKEYDRLVQSIAEIDQSMTVFADEACVAGTTEIATVFHGFQTIEWLTKNKRDRFPVYCYNFEKDDYTIGWAYDPRVVKTAETIKIILDNGEIETVTPDHRILLRNGQWTHACKLKTGDELMPFYRINASQNHTKMRTHQFPRIWTFNTGWIHERQFIDEWRLDKKQPQYERVNKISTLITSGAKTKVIATILGVDVITVKNWVKNEGFTVEELSYLSRKNKDRRRIIGIQPGPTTEVYDLSVEQYENFCTRSLVMHNCQKNDEGRVFKIECENKEIKEDLEYLFFHREMLNFDQRTMWDKSRRLFSKGDQFWELCVDPDNPKLGIVKIKDLPPESMYRIETNKSKLLEFQQSEEGPDYEALKKGQPINLTDAELAQGNAIRFTPEEVIHIRLGDYRKTFYPYGVSLIEPARGPAHQMRQMEDAMIVYRLVRAPERRVFYIDIGQLPSAKAEAFVERLKDQFRKKKVVTRGGTGPSAVDEKWHAPAADEDYFVPVKRDSNTRIETLPGACLALNTEIPLLDGRTLTLNEIIKEHESGKKLWAYSCNPKTGKPAPGLITWAGITRKNTQVVKLNFDNGKSITCTPDHKFPIIGKGFVEAQNLAIGESVIPFNKRMEPIQKNRQTPYEQVYDTEAKKWVFTHRMVAQAVKNTEFGQTMVYLEEYANEPKNVDLRKSLTGATNTKQTKNVITFPKPIFDMFMKGLSADRTVQDILDEINSNTEFMSLFEQANKHIKRKTFNIEDGIKPTHVERMVQSHGYKDLQHAKEEVACYNHKIVSIEWLEEPMDTGTITIDGNELLHDYHTFAIADICYTKNSNLGEVDDVVYFRNKLFTALNFPKNYFSTEDPNATRITLSAQDVKFARLIERLQSYIEEALIEVADRHLRLRGFPPESYQDLKIKMTPPSDWREMSRAEVLTNRINTITALKGSQVMADFDLLTKFMKYTEEEANEIISRNKIQKLEDLKMQILAQNPTLVGVGQPGQNEQEMGAEPGGPNPQLGAPPDGMPPGGMPPPPPGGPPMPPPPQQNNNMLPPAAQAKPLPDPTDEEIAMYDMEIYDYSFDQDQEDVDYSEIE